jgi:hypothetical protein
LETRKEMNDQDNMKFITVFRPRDPVQAGMIREALVQASVNCYVNNETVQVGCINIGAGSMSIMVPEDQAEQARDIITGLGME